MVQQDLADCTAFCGLLLNVCVTYVWINNTMTPWLGNTVLLYCVEEMWYMYLMLLCVVGHALTDYLMRSVESPPQVGQKVLCRHPFQESKRAFVIPSRVELLYKVCIIQTAWLLCLINISVVAWCACRCLSSSSSSFLSPPFSSEPRWLSWCSDKLQAAKSGVRILAVTRDFLLSKLTRLALGTTWHYIEWVLGFPPDSNAARAWHWPLTSV